MTLPAVNIVQVDGGLGVQPPAGGSYLAVVGPSNTGPFLTPAVFARPKDLIATFGGGPLVEEGCIWAQRYGRPVIAVRTQGDTVGAFAAPPVKVGTGTSVVTAGVTEPVDDLDIVIVFINGGTIATTGITYQYSDDGGRTMSPTTSLGVATSILVPGTGATFLLGVGTIVAGDTITASTKQPAPNAAHVSAALLALQNSNLPWEFAQFAFPIDGLVFDAIEASFASLFAAGKYRTYVGGFRRVNPGETEALYKTAFDVLNSKATIIGTITAGDAKISSAVDGHVNRRRISAAVGPLQASVSEEINIADIGLGPLSGVTIADANGNPENHDEAAFPGLDDSRALTLRTWSNREGVFVTRPRVLCPTGSDFTIQPYRRVMNLYMSTLLLYLQERLAKPMRVSRKTGFILEADAVEIERGALARLRPALLAKPKASDIAFSVARNDVILSTKTLTCDGGVLPLFYPEFINVTVGFFNPALQVVAV